MCRRLAQLSARHQDMMRARISSSTSLLYGGEKFGDRFPARFGAEIAFAVDADAYGVGFHVAFSNHEHGVDFHLFGARDFFEVKLASQNSRFSGTL